MMRSERDAIEIESARDHLWRRHTMAVNVIDKALLAQRGRRHELVDVLLDIRCLLAPTQ